MNQFQLILVLAVAMIGQVQARIGFTLEQCRRAYGKEVKSAPSMIVPHQTAYGFVSNDLYVYAVLSQQGKVVDITYFDDQAKVALSPSSQAALWDLNVDKDRVWDDTFYRTIALTTGWNGKRAYKKLGGENYLHSVLYESNGPNALVENANQLGFQVRTLEQFWLEQKAVRQLAVKQGAVWP